MVEDRREFGVDSDYQVTGLPGVYSLGASSFPVGSHGHPTLAAIMTAVEFINRLSAQS